jgi:hypothetical protein
MTAPLMRVSEDFVHPSPAVMAEADRFFAKQEPVS